MRFSFRQLLLLGSMALLWSCTSEEPVQTPNQPAPLAKAIEGQYIVVLKPSSNFRLDKGDYTEQLAVATAYTRDMLDDYRLSDRAERIYGSALLGFSGRFSDSEIAALRQDKRVAYVEQDYEVKLAPSNNNQVSAFAQSIPWGVTRVGYASGAGKTAWVIDSGVDLDHPDLNVDVARSRTFITTGADSRSADDRNGHGSHVAGTIAAKNNSVGVLGVAYDATVVAVKVLNSQGSGSYSGVIAGVDYVAGAAKAGEVANMSLGGPVSQALDDAILRAAGKGILFALAAGNESVNAGTTSPARVNHPNVYTISAMDNAGKFASFSNFGNPPVDYCAPGVSINSTWKGGAYNTISGTSMASPHVAGLLLITGGALRTSGSVTGDPDGNPDPIASK